MTKLKFLFLFFIIIAGVFVASLFLEIGSVKLQQIWFSVALFLIAMYSLLYSWLFKMDSSLYYGVLLALISVFSAYRYIQKIDFKFYYPIYIACFALASFAVFVAFRQNIHYKIFAILGIEAILLMCYKINLLPLQVVIAINIAYFTFVGINAIFRLRKNLRRE